MKLPTKLLSGAALALALSGNAFASPVDYTYSYTSADNQTVITADFSVDTALSNKVLASGTFTVNGISYGFDKSESSFYSQTDAGNGTGYNFKLSTFASYELMVADNVINNVTTKFVYYATSTGATYVPNVVGTLAVKTPNTSATAVPEPEAYAMMLAGLGLVGFAVRRKQQAV